jgi:hypothetical protein
MTFQLVGLPVLGGPRRPTLKDSGDDYYEDYSYDDGSDGEDTGDGEGESSQTDEIPVDDSETPTLDEGAPAYDETPVQAEDGSWSFLDVDGTAYYEDPEGNTMVTNSDGSGTAYMTDGTIYSWDKDGNEVSTDAEGNPTKNSGPEEADASSKPKSEARSKAQNLAQKATDAFAKTSPNKPAAATNNPLAKKTVATASTPKVPISGATIAGMSVGTLLILGATGAALYYFNKKRR